MTEFSAVPAYTPYPNKPFLTVQEAQIWVDGFVDWYNKEHLHSSIRFIAPDDRHFGREHAILAKRCRLYMNKKQQTPSRWAKNTRKWTPVGTVYLNQKRR